MNMRRYGQCCMAWCALGVLAAAGCGGAGTSDASTADTPTARVRYVRTNMGIRSTMEIVERERDQLCVFGLNLAQAFAGYAPTWTPAAQVAWMQQCLVLFGTDDMQQDPRAIVEAGIIGADEPWMHVGTLPRISVPLEWPSIPGYRISRFLSWRHRGIDIAVPQGTVITASGYGEVVFAGWHGTYGQEVTIDHGNGVRTRYAHASKLLVKKGQRVSRGQQVALVGTTGHSSGPHIHYETIVADRQVHPLLYVGVPGQEPPGVGRF